MDKKINKKKLFFFIALIALGIFTRISVLWIIAVVFLLGNLKAKSKNPEKNNTGRKNYYKQPSVPMKTTKNKTYSSSSGFTKSEEQKQREKWAKRRDKDPWEWDE